MKMEPWIWPIIVVAVALLVLRGWRLVVCAATVYDGYRGLYYYRGVLQSALEPGFYLFWGIHHRVSPIDVRRRESTIAGQEVISSDGAPVRVSLIASYSIADPVVLERNIEDMHDTIYTNCQLAMRDLVCRREIDDLMQSRSELGEELRSIVAPRLAEHGIRLESVGVRDLSVPADMKRALMQAVRARKEGQAALERARAEAATLRSLANTARILAENPHLLQLRLVHALAESSNATIMLNADPNARPVKPE